MRRLTPVLFALPLAVLGACGPDSGHPPPALDPGDPDAGRRPAPELDAGADADILPDHELISTSSRTELEAETSLAMAADGTLVSVWIAFYASGASDIGYAISRDRGATWSAPQLMGDPTGRDSGDPVVVVDPDGNFWAAWLAFHRTMNGDATDFALYVAKLASGANAFAAPITVDTFASGDKPWISVTKDKTLLVGYLKDAAAGGGTLSVARSVDGASTWSKSDAYTFESTSFANFAVPCTSPTSSRVWLTYFDASSSGASWSQSIRWSDDDGLTWPAANTAIVAKSTATAAPTLEPAACAASGSDVWIGYGAWTSAPATQDTPADEYHVAHTTDGVTFDTTTASDGATKVMALGTVIAEGPGVVSATYYAGDQENDVNGSVRRVRSTDGGKTWSPSQKIGAGIRFTVDRASNAWLGDYLGTAAKDGTLYVTFGDNQAGGATHIAFASVPAP